MTVQGNVIHKRDLPRGMRRGVDACVETGSDHGTSSFQYRAGVLTNPSWTNFLPVEYEIVGDGSSGLIRIYGGIAQHQQHPKFFHVAGYKIDFEHETDATKHTLPFDLARTCATVYRQSVQSASPWANSHGCGKPWDLVREDRTRRPTDARPLYPRSSDMAVMIQIRNLDRLSQAVKTFASGNIAPICRGSPRPIHRTSS